MRRRVPWLTLGVLVTTLVTTAAMIPWPWIGGVLQRDPAMLTGEWWRFVTAWFVLVDGWGQIALNSLGLAVYGALAELLIGRAWWLIAYVTAGLVGEVAGVFWQPVGGGNSVAICGLIGLFSAWQAMRRTLPGAARFLGPIVWGGLGLWLAFRGDIHGPALIAGFVVGVAHIAWRPGAGASA